MERGSAALLLAAATLLLEAAAPASAFSPRIRYQGRDWSPAQPTDAAVEYRPGIGDVSPAPTAAARHADFGSVELFKREFVKGTDTCGFAAQYKSEPWTCFRLGASCVSFSTAMGCCVGSEPNCYSTILTTCHNYVVGVTSCAPGTLCCPSTSPSCFTWQYSASKDPGSTYSLFNCYAQGGTGTLVDTPPGLTATGATTARSDSTTLNPATQTSSAMTTPTPPTPTPTPDSSSSSNNNIGAIVGGVVGGVAVIAAVIVAVVWLVMRSRRAKANQAAPSAAAAATGAPPSPHQGGGSSPAVSPGPTTTTPSLMPHVSPAMTQTGYFSGQQPPSPPQQHHHQQTAGSPNGYGAYYDPAKQQPSPVYSDPRYSMVKPQHMSHSTYGAGSSPWTTPTSPHAPSELANTSPMGTAANRAELQ